MNASHISRCRTLHAKGFSYGDIASVVGHTTGEVYFVIHGHKKPRKQQTASEAIEELLLEGHDVRIVEANFAGSI